LIVATRVLAFTPMQVAVKAATRRTAKFRNMQAMHTERLRFVLHDPKPLFDVREKRTLTAGGKCSAFRLRPYANRKLFPGASFGQ